MDNNLVDYGFSVDIFNNPKEYIKTEGISMLLCRLILLEPGTFQSHPDMGVGLVSRYRYKLDDGSLVSELQDRIKNQIDTYIPHLASATVNAIVKKHMLIISIEISNFVYNMLYNPEDNSLKTVYRSLNDL